MKSLARQIACLAAILLVICLANRLSHGNAYTAFLPVENGAAPVRVVPASGDGIEVGKTRQVRDHVRVDIVPRERGEAEFRVYGVGMPVEKHQLRVGPMMTVYDVSTGGFTGDTVVLLSVTLFFLLVAAIMIWYYVRISGPAFYAYTTIYAAGFSLFALLTGGVMAYVTARHLMNPTDFPMLSAYAVISRAGYHFMIFTAPLVALFAVAMTVSNIALMKHERPRPRNALGILAGLALIGGELLALCLNQGMQRPGSREDLWETLLGVYPTVFVYFECMLIGAIVCGLRAAWHEPAGEWDCVIILGCLFRRDGTLTPLLRGRVDRALEFGRSQAALGKRVVYIPSGGQGADEPMPEARAMANYMLEQGVPEGRIIPEERSRNTYENMTFSKAIIDRIHPGARVMYVTTNYHVFRSGVWSNLAGLHAEGLGSDTRWWYWPNAFMREVAGLMLNRWRQVILLLVILVGFFGLLAALL